MIEKSMPPEIEPAFESLRQECISAFSYWVLFQQAFMCSEDRVELWNRAGGAFFKAVQDSMRDTILLSIVRMCDPEKTGKSENMSLAHLAATIDADLHPELYIDLQDRLKVISSMVEPIRTLRNKVLAHLDRPVALKANESLWPGIGTKLIQEVLDAISEFINKVDSYYQGTSTGFEHVIHHGDADTLAFYVEVGLSEEESYVNRSVRNTEQTDDGNGAQGS